MSKSVATDVCVLQHVLFGGPWNEGRRATCLACEAPIVRAVQWSGRNRAKPEVRAETRAMFLRQGFSAFEFCAACRDMVVENSAVGVMEMVCKVTAASEYYEGLDPAEGADARPAVRRARLCR